MDWGSRRIASEAVGIFKVFFYRMVTRIMFCIQFRTFCGSENIIYIYTYFMLHGSQSHRSPLQIGFLSSKFRNGRTQQEMGIQQTGACKLHCDHVLSIFPQIQNVLQNKYICAIPSMRSVTVLRLH